MSCQQYQQIYQEFQGLKQRYSQKMEELRETGTIDQELKNLKQQLQEKQKEMRPLLEKYFSRWKFTDEIKGFDTASTFLRISEHEVLVGGTDRTLKILNTQTKQFIKFHDPETQELTDEIQGFEKTITSLLPISDHEILVRGADSEANGKVRILKRELDWDQFR